MTAIVGAGGKGKEKERERLTSPGAEEYNEKREEGEREKGKGKEDKPEPVFDFNRFLEQMRMRSADPIAKYLRSYALLPPSSLLFPYLPLTLSLSHSFLKEFSRRPPQSTTDQTRVINDFLDFIAGKMRTCDPWRSIVEVECKGDPERGEMEFEMAMEAMEKLVMNRLWHLCVFSLLVLPLSSPAFLPFTSTRRCTHQYPISQHLHSRPRPLPLPRPHVPLRRRRAGSRSLAADSALRVGRAEAP
jgi:hypothetical protein